eukprot:gnl/TRDRNA2_/TRDRNA2_175367_c1_seq14.p1 gnl/TRDRNA2_/TRDRNA2_175367_c1~~gnl/TRDRNA2_/TRDRNA2_175367_c1_seq14.p1  ORF type:complete len:173 (+),score=27.82 gnl/TRDRNA2_/TRDRNA2_175367_c1_seq14:627-1145(+)
MARFAEVGASNIAEPFKEFWSSLQKQVHAMGTFGNGSSHVDVGLPTDVSIVEAVATMYCIALHGIQVSGFLIGWKGYAAYAAWFSNLQMFNVSQLVEVFIHGDPPVFKQAWRPPKQKKQRSIHISKAVSVGCKKHLVATDENVTRIGYDCGCEVFKGPPWKLHQRVLGLRML